MRLLDIKSGAVDKKIALYINVNECQNLFTELLQELGADYRHNINPVTEYTVRRNKPSRQIIPDIEQIIELLSDTSSEQYRELFTNYDIVPSADSADNSELETKPEAWKNTNSKKPSTSPRHEAVQTTSGSYHQFEKIRDDVVQKLKAFRYAPKSIIRLNELKDAVDTMRSVLRSDKRYLNDLPDKYGKTHPDFSSGGTKDSIQAAVSWIDRVMGATEHEALDKISEMARQSSVNSETAQIR